MSKKHKVIVTRDKDGAIIIWPYNAEVYLNTKGWWDSRRLFSIIDICSSRLAKRCLGFTPRKGSKHVLTITREKK